MECEKPEYGQSIVCGAWQAGSGRGKLALGAAEVGGVRLGGAATASGARSALPVHFGVVAPHPHSLCEPPSLLPKRVLNRPFINEMDEITYWVYTKRAPCLMNYDNLIRKQYETTQAIKKCKSDRSVPEEVPSPKKKKRKLSLFEEDGVSVTKQPNVYFEPSQNKDRTVLSSCKSDTMESNIDFNIKNSSIQDKSKKIKGPRNGRTIHKKNKVVTSTPLRRSLRRAQNCINNNEQFNVSFDTFNCTIDNRNNILVNTKHRSKKSSTRTPVAERAVVDSKKETPLPEKPKNEVVMNGQFEDLSDVSGFTANYIRSTKLHSTNSKPNRSLRSKGNRNLSRQPRRTQQANNSSMMLVCVNKSVNATAEVPHTSALNYSTDSSTNVINMITSKNSQNHSKVNKSTSLLKFLNANIKESNSNTKVDSSKSISKINEDNSVQNKTNSRYPKRYKNHSTDVTVNSAYCDQVRQSSASKRKAPSHNVAERNSSYWNETPADSSLSKTRSGRNLALSTRQADKTVLVYSNSTEPSSLNIVNVGDQDQDSAPSKLRAKRVNYHKHGKRSINKSRQSLQKDSIREKSGFAACFSDSDGDSEAQKHRKFFC